MKDRKLEVQEMAAGTLAGMLKSLAEPAFDSLRIDLLQQAQQLFPSRRKRAAGQSSRCFLLTRFAIQPLRCM